MERLTGKNNDYCFTVCGGERKYIREDCNIYKVCFERQIYEQLKHYEDLEESGRLVVLPEEFDRERATNIILEQYCPSYFGIKDLETCLEFSEEGQQKCKDCWEAAMKGESNEQI